METKEFINNVREGMIIKVPQYNNTLEVTFVPDSGDIKLVGLEFTNPDQKNNTGKRIVFNHDKSKMYLQAGNTDKGAIESIEVIER